MSHTRFETLLYEKTGPVATLTLNRPERMNGMTNRMVLEAGEALAAAAEDRDVRVLVLTGAGRAFSPGADLQVVASAQARPEEHLTAEDFRAAVLLHGMPAVTIAAINGACAGAALGWACACDFRFATASARFNTAFLDVGVAGDMGGPWTLARIVGPARARELYFFPDKFDAAEALRIGVVSRVFPDERFRDEVHAVAARLANAASQFRRRRAHGLRGLRFARERASFAHVHDRGHPRSVRGEGGEAQAAVSGALNDMLRLRQIALVARTLAPVVDELQDVFGLVDA
jgi:2-(1,2-epoxy-1,2-dihydrophenyl)acetyl-CoA isomerase